MSIYAYLYSTFSAQANPTMDQNRTSFVPTGTPIPVYPNYPHNRYSIAGNNQKNHKHTPIQNRPITSKYDYYCDHGNLHYNNMK